jgi:hypothetical protein
MHASTRILMLLLAIVAIVVGWWVLYAINSPVVAVVYGILLTGAVLIATRLLLAIGFGFNRLTAGRGREDRHGPIDARTALDELAQLRDRELISSDEYDAKRAGILERL